jgi:hypothetical protein
MSKDSCVLEIFFARFPFDDPDANVDLWQDVDEQHFPARLRKSLAGNGFRVGLVGGQMPMALSKLLELGDKPAPAGDAAETKVTDMKEEPTVLRRRLQTRAACRSEVVSSDTYDQLPVLIAADGQVCGETYCQAQAIWAVKAFPEADGRVRIELVPELHHDQTRQRWVGKQGMLRLETSRPRRVFDDMAISATLSPGAMLVMTSLPNRTGSLGHHFFTEKNDQLEQKLVVIRLAQTQHDDLFSPSTPLDLDERPK